MKKNLLVVTITLALACTACGTAWVTIVDSLLAAAAPALVNILQIVAISEGKPINTGLAAKINADAGVIKQLASDYATASSAAGPGVCAQLGAALGVYGADITLVEQVAQVSDKNTQEKILLLSGLVTGTVQAIIAVVPACHPAGASVQMAVKASTPPKDAQAFVAKYNAAMTAKTGNAAVDGLTPKLTLSKHGKMVSRTIHVFTLGLAK